MLGSGSRSAQVETVTSLLPVAGRSPSGLAPFDRMGLSRFPSREGKMSKIPGREPYRSAAEALLKESGCTVRKWRSRTTGTAFVRDFDWGIEAPEPRGAISFATFAHEVGHQMLHRQGNRPRWLEELEAWEYALAQFERFELPGVESARTDAAKALVYAAGKADRRGCSPDTARHILDRYPEWVWSTDVSCALASIDIEERAASDPDA